MATESCLVLTVPETAVLLGVSRAFAYELVARKELPALRLGRRLVVPKAALDGLLNRVEAGALFDPAMTTSRSNRSPSTKDRSPVIISAMKRCVDYGEPVA